MARIAGTEIRPGVFDPLVTILLPGLQRPDGSVVTWRGLAIVDSGADFSIIPAEIFLAAGVDWDKLPAPIETSHGAGGPLRYRWHDGNLIWEGHVIATRYAVGELGRVPLPLLGRDDFFRRFNVRFRWFKTPPEIEIDPGVVASSRTRRRAR